MLQKLLWLALAGALGTVSRYLLGGLVQRYAGGSFPWGTLAVNGIGCLLFGVIWSLAAERSILTPETRALVLIGFLGAFTTFSSFAFETAQMIRDSQWLYAGVNLVAQNVLGLVFVFVGFALGRALGTGGRDET